MEFYNEVVICTDKYYELFLDLLENLCDDAIEEDNGKLILRTLEDTDDIVFGIEDFANQLRSNLGEEISCKVSVAKIKNEDWVTKYKESITPIEVGNFYVRPTWCERKENKIEIIIDPALAFGSGHHETTSSCLKFIEKYVESGDELLDVGCGSGILAIGASKLGAICDVCDTDILAVDNARKNFELNGVLPKASWEGSANNTTQKYDVVVANIVADVLIFINKDLKKCLKNEAILILSGILDIHKDKVLKKFSEFEIIEELGINEWYSVVLKEKN